MSDHLLRAGEVAPGDRIDYAASGIPTEAQFVAAYRDAAGRDGVGDWDSLSGFAAFRPAAIAQGVYVRRRGASPAEPVADGARRWAGRASSLID